MDIVQCTYIEIKSKNNQLKIFTLFSSFRIMIGFMIPTAFLSMWISNAATAAMMLPIMEAVLEQLKLEKSLRFCYALNVIYIIFPIFS